MKKNIKNINIIARKLGLALTKATNQKLEVVRKERKKREKMIEKRKIEAMATKCQKVRGRISLSNKKKKNYENDTKDETDLD